MSTASEKMLYELSLESKERLVECLNDSNFLEIGSIKGVGVSSMVRLLSMHVDYAQQSSFDLSGLYTIWLATDGTWPSFTVSQNKRVCYQTHQNSNEVRTRGFWLPGRLDYSFLLSRVFTAPAVKHLLAHFGLPLRKEVNEALVEIRDIRQKLDTLIRMEDPVVKDYLRQLQHEISSWEGKGPRDT